MFFTIHIFTLQKKKQQHGLYNKKPHNECKCDHAVTVQVT